MNTFLLFSATAAGAQFLRQQFLQEQMIIDYQK